MKGIKKDKQILFLETEKRHADLKIKLKHYGITQSDFIRGCISGLINDDEQFLQFFFKVLEELPEWYMWLLFAGLSSAIGYRGVDKLMKFKKK